MDREIKTHESYGLASFSRRSDGEINLFGSSIKHSNTIALKISRAEVDRHLEQDWFHGRKELIEVEMSQTQFADLITSMNMGDGVPVTIKYVNGQRMEPCPHENKRQQHAKEFNERMQNLSSKLDGMTKDFFTMIEKRLPKKDQDDAKSMLNSLITEIRSNIPFYEKQFQRQMDKTISQAKGEIEAFVQNRIVTAGIVALKEASENSLKELSDGKID